MDASMSAAGGRRLTGPKVLAWLLGFFGLVMAVNGVFVYLALDSFSGLSTEQAYQKGLSYNETLRAGRAQRALGWRARVESEWRGLDRPARIDVTLQDRDGAPLAGLSLSGNLRWPVKEGSDRALTFTDLGDGRYAGEAVLPYPGNWDLSLVAVRGDGAEMRIERRLWLTSSR